MIVIDHSYLLFRLFIQNLKNPALHGSHKSESRIFTDRTDFNFFNFPVFSSCSIKQQIITIKLGHIKMLYWHFLKNEFIIEI